MSKLDELINKLCPNGVEYKEIGELTEYEQPTKYIVESTKYDDAYQIPVLTAGQTFILGYTNEKNGVYEATKENPVIIFDDFTAAFKWVDFPFKVKSSAMKIITIKNDTVLIRYLYHYMGVLNYSSSDHTRLWIGTYSSIKIPVPPMEVQCEIVRILDKFTQLTAELTAELTARKKQYEYYLNSIINNNYPKCYVKDICKSISSGGTPNTGNSSYYGGNIPWLRTQEVDFKEINKTEKFITEEGLNNSSAKWVEKNTVIIAMYGATVGKVGYTSIPLTTNQACCNLTTNDKMNYKFLYYVLYSKYEEIKAMGQGSQTNINAHIVKNLEIPFPPLEEQQRIVNLLDKFDSLCNDLTKGLPAEIEARKKQYEYYRDRLLTFKELED